MSENTCRIVQVLEINKNVVDVDDVMVTATIMIRGTVKGNMMIDDGDV